ncbi:MAG: DUF2232 domain-containing protein [Gammaproteobacteria bacterium]|nr:DUF2232 domain-containing protein [Gammaproteobacteria bacterium]
MEALLRFIVKGRTQGVTAASAAFVLAFLLPPLLSVSGAIVGLFTLRHGILEGGLILTGTTLLAGAATFGLLHSVGPALVFVLTTGIPALILAEVLRRTASQGVALALAGVGTGLAVLGFYLVVDDPVAWSRELLQQAFVEPMSSRPDGDARALATLERWADHFAPALPYFMTAAALIGAMAVLWLARWAHAVLDNPGGFGREFRELRLPRPTAWVALALAALALVTGGASGGVLASLVMLAVVLYAIQGLSLAHAVVRARSLSVAWLWVLYVLLVVTREATFALAIAGLSDSWLDFRARFRPRT